jgi:RNA polymerase sigma-70 factor (ECF subfamily)
LPDPGVTPEQAMQDSELSAAIQECINGLHPDQRVVLVMNDIEGYSYQEIAYTTAVQLGTVKSRLSRARASLRHCLQAVQELLPDEYRLVSDD